MLGVGVVAGSRPQKFWFSPRSLPRLAWRSGATDAQTRSVPAWTNPNLMKAENDRRFGRQKTIEFGGSDETRTARHWWKSPRPRKWGCVAMSHICQLIRSSTPSVIGYGIAATQAAIAPSILALESFADPHGVKYFQ